jgi:hypothetical protein
MKRTVLFLMVGALTIALASLAFANGSPESTTLSGAEEVGGGDTDGTGTADLRLNQGQGRVCFDLTWANISSVTGGHIHKAPAGSNGPIVVDLLGGPSTSTTGAGGCVTGVAKSLVKDIRKNSSSYYVNVHSSEFMGGAIRGQLGD